MNAVIMLCRNSLELTKKAVESVLAQDIPVQLYIVNNDSTDGTEQWLLDEQLLGSNIKIYAFKPPLGVSMSWNFALNAIFRTNDFALVVNNDVVLRSDTYRSLLEDGGPFVTAVSVNNMDGIEGDWAKSSRPHPDFSCFLIRKRVWDQVGPFDSAMVHYCSDCDYHLRMYRAGITAYTIGIPFFHYASGTLKTATAEEQLKIVTQADADRDTFEKKYGVRVGTKGYYDLFGSEAP